MGEAVDGVQHAAVERGQRDEQQVGKGDAPELDGHRERRRLVAHAGGQHGHHPGHGEDQQRGERHQHQQQRGLGLSRENHRLGPTAALQFAREQRHEGGREGALGEQAAEEVGKLEGDEEGVRHGARAQHRRQHDVAHEAHNATEQRESADRRNGPRETHALLVCLLSPVRGRGWARGRRTSCDPLT
jgi:hypothetical protein